MTEAGEFGPALDASAHRTGFRFARDVIGERPTVLLFHGRDNQDEGRGAAQSIRNVHRSADDLCLANVVDLSMYPRLMRKLVNHDLDVAFDRELAILPGDLDPDRHIVIIPDQSGETSRAWGVTDAARILSGVLLDAHWRIRRTASGPGVADVMLAGLADLGLR